MHFNINNNNNNKNKKPFDKLADQFKSFESKYANKITKVINDAAATTAKSGNHNNDKEKEGKEEWEEVEVDDWVRDAERIDAWEKYLKDNGIIIDYTDRHNNQYSDIVFALYQQFTQEWNQQPPRPRKTIRYKKPTEKEVAAWKEERKRIANYRDENGKDFWGFD